MGTLLAPRCDECGAMANECAEGYLLVPGTLEVICLRCFEPDQEKRNEITRGAIRASLWWFREEHSRLPDSSVELVAWLSEKHTR